MIIKTSLFDNISLVVIVANSVVMVFDTEVPPPPFFVLADNIFLILYTIEATLKIIGLGFIIGDGAYIKDPWNILDFSIVAISYAAMSGPSEDSGAGTAPG